MLDLFQNLNGLTYGIPINKGLPCARPIPGESLGAQDDGESEPVADGDGEDHSAAEEVSETELEEDDPIVEVEDWYFYTLSISNL